MTPTPASIEEISSNGQAVLDAVKTVVVGMDEALSTALAAVLAGGHVLFEDLPGLGKTVAARSMASALGLDFARLQCTPDLLPADVTGSFVWDPATREFNFRPGPVFTGLLLADEINRTSPRTQSALLEAMAEGQVSAEGRTYRLPSPFHVIATSNPVELEGTFPLPEAQLDRFMVRLSVGYLSSADETTVLMNRVARRAEATRVDSVITAEQVLAMQAGVEAIDVNEDVAAYCVALAAATRAHPEVEVGVSPRGAQSLLLLCRAKAALAGRDFIIPDDVRAVATPALAHRLTLTARAWAGGTTGSSIITSVLDTVPVPDLA
ncbi:ATPase [Bowdeniella nasicola]|uniref:ATPase n=1 Tax=Bowdeniella nasicola TaxID=208480 RepID=A0A1Q5Q463_9ACTO|nr:MoxR family ATPase [Bowdeniella nasicola]OKL54618.1 ATPase [Bowdeniella nasicola]